MQGTVAMKPALDEADLVFAEEVKDVIRIADDTTETTSKFLVIKIDQLRNMLNENAL